MSYDAVVIANTIASGSNLNMKEDRIRQSFDALAMRMTIDEFMEFNIEIPSGAVWPRGWSLMEGLSARYQ